MPPSNALEQALHDSEELVLETRGRQTGRPHRVTLWFAYEAPDIWLRADRESDWQRNIEQDSSCRITVAGVSADARREAVEDEDAALRHVVELWRAKYGPEWVADWYVERGRAPVRIRVSTR